MVNSIPALMVPVKHPGDFSEEQQGSGVSILISFQGCLTISERSNLKSVPLPFQEHFSGCSSNPQSLAGLRLGVDRENMIQGMYLSELNSVWLEAVVMEMIYYLQLVLQQKSTLGSSLRSLPSNF